MRVYAKFAILVVAIVGILIWLAAGGISETKTYYKTIAELNAMGARSIFAWAATSSPALLSAPPAA